MAQSAIINKPPTGAVDQGATSQNPGWPPFFSTVFAILNSATRSGTTAERPTDNDFRWLWMPYGDTTLGKPIWLKSIGPDVWVDATGTPV